MDRRKRFKHREQDYIYYGEDKCSSDEESSDTIPDDLEDLIEETGTLNKTNGKEHIRNRKLSN